MLKSIQIIPFKGEFQSRIYFINKIKKPSRFMLYLLIANVC
jgi:hypothetical protein